MQREAPHRYTEKMYRRGGYQVIMEAKTEAMPTQSKKMEPPGVKEARKGIPLEFLEEMPFCWQLDFRLPAFKQ